MNTPHPSFVRFFIALPGDFDFQNDFDSQLWCFEYGVQARDDDGIYMALSPNDFETFEAFFPKTKITRL